MTASQPLESPKGIMPIMATPFMHEVQPIDSVFRHGIMHEVQPIHSVYPIRHSAKPWPNTTQRLFCCSIDALE
jgi:hypothetical protein